MDTDSVRQHAQAHGDAVVRGDLDAVTADFVPELRPQVPEIAKGLPQPTTSAEVLSVEDAGDHTNVEIRTQAARTLSRSDHSGRSGRARDAR
jgi:5,10-methenyltetrahydromethanopterin hydrogenase